MMLRQSDRSGYCRRENIEPVPGIRLASATILRVVALEMPRLIRDGAVAGRRLSGRVSSQFRRLASSQPDMLRCRCQRGIWLPIRFLFLVVRVPASSHPSYHTGGGRVLFRFDSIVFLVFLFRLSRPSRVGRPAQRSTHAAKWYSSARRLTRRSKGCIIHLGLPVVYIRHLPCTGNELWDVAADAAS